MTAQQQALEALAHDLTDIRTMQAVAKDLMTKIDLRLEKYITQLDKYTVEYGPRVDHHKGDGGVWP